MCSCSSPVLLWYAPRKLLVASIARTMAMARKSVSVFLKAFTVPVAYTPWPTQQLETPAGHAKVRHGDYA